MLKLRLLPSQSILPAWLIQQCRNVRTIQSSKATPKPKPPPPTSVRDSLPSIPSTPHLSLLEELFPEEATKVKTPSQSPNTTTKPDRDIPPLPLSPDLDDGSSAHAKTRRKNSTGLSRRRDGRIGTLSAEARDRTEMTVMVFRNGSKSLCEDDFRRVVPKGKHIEGWKGQGDILKGWCYVYLYPNPTSRNFFPSSILEKDGEDRYLRPFAQSYLSQKKTHLSTLCSNPPPRTPHSPPNRLLSPPLSITLLRQNLPGTPHLPAPHGAHAHAHLHRVAASATTGLPARRRRRCLPAASRICAHPPFAALIVALARPALFAHDQELAGKGRLRGDCAGPGFEHA